MSANDIAKLGQVLYLSPLYPGRVARLPVALDPPEVVYALKCVDGGLKEQQIRRF